MPVVHGTDLFRVNQMPFLKTGFKTTYVKDVLWLSDPTFKLTIISLSKTYTVAVVTMLHALVACHLISLFLLSVQMFAILYRVTNC